MEKADMKIPVIMEEKKSGVAGRVVALLAGGVVLLAVAVIVLIACGTYVIQQQNECEETTAVAPLKESSEEFDHETRANGTVYNEHTIVYAESRREFSVNRDPKTGFVASVVFVDYNQDKSVVYDAKSHTCFLSVDALGEFDDLSEVPRAGAGKEVHYEVGTRVDDSSDLPTEMAPFCSTSNSYWLRESENNPEHRQKRNWYYCWCLYVYANGYYIFIEWYEYGGCSLYCHA